MSLNILYNIAALRATNQLSVTSAASANSLRQLSSGLRINSGSDDAAGLSIANSLNANVLALNQSNLNATNAIGALQTADRGLSQVTVLLNRSVTLATEAATSGLSTAQSTAINQEFKSLMTQVDNINTKTSFNGTAVFGSTVSAFTSDGTAKGTTQISTAIDATGTVALGLNTSSLASAGTAATALNQINAAISTVSAERGTIGATVERLQAASSVLTQQAQNLQLASSSILSANISTVVANNTKYSILQQSGISALRGASRQAQIVLKLLK